MTTMGGQADTEISNTPDLASNGSSQPAPSEQQWHPETVIATLATQPQAHSTSPLSFFHLLGRLKTTKREGWRRFGIQHGESISDHMYRMALITMLCPASLSTRLDLNKCTRMALVHDMAESLVGDITPVDGVSKPEKNRREAETMDYICKTLLGKVDGGQQAQQIRDVWQEYEDGVTLESQFVHDVDKMELLLQMLEYEQEHEGRLDLSEFSWVATRITLPEVQQWATDLLATRRQFWDSTGKSTVDSHLSDDKKQQHDEYYGKGRP